MKVKETQLGILYHLLRRARSTRYGTACGFDRINDYPSYRRNIPFSSYRDLEPMIEEMKTGGKDILWPGRIDRFAVSSGTSGKGKHLPVSDERLKSDRRFIRTLCFSYLRQRPNLFRLAGRYLSLPGSVEKKEGLLLGEISGFTAMESPWWIRPFQLEDPGLLAGMKFGKKFDHITERVIRERVNIKVISAAPTWILTLFQRLLERTGCRSIAEIWPGLRLLVCGGVKLSNYRPHLEMLAGDLQLDFIETYGSSEGYFAFTDHLDREDLGLVIDNGIFYEFVPDPPADPSRLTQQSSVPLWEAEPGVPYAMLVTTDSGLWRYALNDVVEFTSTRPPRVVVKGRLTDMLDDFGEALTIWEAEEALSEAVRVAGVEKGIFTLGSSLDTASELPRHHWFIQFNNTVPAAKMDLLASTLDEHLIAANRHYAVRRESGVLAPPVLYRITQADINNWHDFTGKKSAQSKLPRLLTRAEDIEFFRNRL